MFTGDQSDLLAGEANSPLSPVLGQSSVLVLDGAEHMRQRKLLLPPFQGSAVNAFREVIREVAAAEIAGWREGDEFPIRERMRALTFEVICRAVFGVTEPERVERLRAALLAVIDMGALFFAPSVHPDRRGPSARGADSAPPRRRRRADLRGDRAPPASRDLEERTDVLSLLLRARDEDGRADERPSSSATSCSRCSPPGTRRPRPASRSPSTCCRATRTSGPPPRRAEGGDDDYLDAVVTETLRIRPVIDAAERTLAKPRTICGYDLPAGIRVYPAIACVHRREDLYPQADRFRPERFLDEATASYTWLPFGGGIRRCIGAALAQAEMAEVIRAVVRTVDLEPVRPELDPVVMRGITMVPKHGTPIRVRSVASRSRRAEPVAA